MKKTVLTLLVTVMAVVVLHAFRAYRKPSIAGRVFPTEAAKDVVLVKDSDSIHARLDNNGFFSVDVQPGNWKMIINARNPYRDQVMDDVLAKEGETPKVLMINLHK